MERSPFLFLIGVPLPIIVLLLLFSFCGASIFDGSNVSYAKSRHRIAMNDLVGATVQKSAVISFDVS